MNRPPLPNRYTIVNKGIAGTIAVRDRNSGRFRGRVASRGKGDSTAIRQVRQDVDVDHNGTIDYRGGTIIGRTPVRSSSRAKAHIRSLR